MPCVTSFLKLATIKVPYDAKDFYEFGDTQVSANDEHIPERVLRGRKTQVQSRKTARKTNNNPERLHPGNGVPAIPTTQNRISKQPTNKAKELRKNAYK